MESLPTTEDLHHTLLHFRRHPPLTVVLCQLDPVPAEIPVGTEALLLKSFGNSCWRLQDGRYLGVYVGQDDVGPRAEALRREVDEDRGSGVHRSLSIGVSSLRPDLGPLDLLLRAERALGAARQAGGNRVAFAPRHETTTSERNRQRGRRP